MNKINFNNELTALKEQNQYRTFKVLNGPNTATIHLGNGPLINFGSNNYLGMSTHPLVLKAFQKGIKKWGAGAGASRLVSGTSTIHRTLEAALAVFSKKDDALLFPTGYMANLGLITALADKDDLVCLDKLNHASIIDGARLSGAKIRVFPHRNMEYLEQILKSAPKDQKKIIITDSIFSMDGDATPLAQLVQLKKEYQATLILDEAHAIGVFGENGGGLAIAQGLIKDVDFKVGTLSKGFGLQGGYVASSKDAIDYLKNKCRPFIYTTGLLPSVCEAALEVLKLFSKMEKTRKSLQKKSSWLRIQLQALQLPTLNSVSQIIPIVIGDTAKVLHLEKQLLKEGFFVPAIRYPTVKKNTERLRISLMKHHTYEHLKQLLAEIKMVLSLS